MTRLVCRRVSDPDAGDGSELTRRSQPDGLRRAVLEQGDEPIEPVRCMSARQKWGLGQMMSAGLP